MATHSRLCFDSVYAIHRTGVRFANTSTNTTASNSTATVRTACPSPASHTHTHTFLTAFLTAFSCFEVLGITWWGWSDRIPVSLCHPTLCLGVGWLAFGPCLSSWNQTLSKLLGCLFFFSSFLVVVSSTLVFLFLCVGCLTQRL